jgi:molybdenum cofactor guanylyltransferase
MGGMVRATGVILAGGASTRMGADKAGVEVAGRTMFQWVRDRLLHVCDAVVVAGRPEGLSGVPGLADPSPDRLGPLAGLAAALEWVDRGHVLLVATDQPWIREETLRALIDRAQDLAVVPVDHDGIRQTTCALYPTSMLPVALDEMYAGGSIQSTLDRTAFVPVNPDEWRSWGEDGRSWFSADTVEAVADGMSRFGDPGPPTPPP